MSIEEFKNNVDNLSTVNGKDIEKLTEMTKVLKDQAIFLVEIIIKSINEVISTKFYKFRAHQVKSFQNFTSLIQ